MLKDLKSNGGFTPATSAPPKYDNSQKREFVIITLSVGAV